MQGVRAGAPTAAGGPALGQRELAHRVLAQAALDVGVGVAPGAAVRAAQHHLPTAGTLLLTAGTLVVQGLRFRRVHGKGPAGPRAVIHGDFPCAASVCDYLGHGDGGAGDPGLIARDAFLAAAVGHEGDGARKAGGGVKVGAGDVGDG